MSPSGALGTTHNSGTFYRTWASSSGTNPVVLSRRDLAIADGTGLWISHGAGSAPVKSEGVAATGYVVSGNVTEIVVYVGADGRLNRGSIFNNGPISWASVLPPTNKTLTGHVAATTYVSGANRYLAVGATTTDNKLYRFVKNLNLPLDPGSWTDSSAGLSWLTSDRLAASTNAAGTIASIFGAHTSGSESLGMVRWNGTTWSTTNLSRPSGKRVCDRIGVAQGQLTPLVGDYRLVVACTPQDGTSAELYLAVATSDNTTTVTWSTYTAAASLWPKAVTAVLRASSPGNYAIDVYTIASSVVLGHRIAKGVRTTATFSITDYGVIPDVDGTTSTLVAAPSGFASRAFFIGTASSRRYLYERYGGVSTSAPQMYRALGDEQPVGFSVENYYAEGMAAIWRGKTALGMLRRPGAGGTSDWPRVHFLYSSDEGKTLSSTREITTSVGGETYDYVADPATAVTDQGLMYSMQLGVDRPLCNETAWVAQATVYAVSSSDGLSFSSPIVFDHETDGNDPDTPIDHPFMDIEHVPWGADVLHAAWWVIEGSPGGIRYATLTEGSTSPSVVQLQSGGGGPPRVTATDRGRVIVYYGTGTGSVRLCEINAQRNGCVQCPSPGCDANGWQTLPSPLNFSTPSGSGPGVSGSDIYIGAHSPVSMALSEAADVLYYCFHKVETNDPGSSDNDDREETDAFCTVATRDTNGYWTWDETPVAVAGVANDDKDQFSPEVVVTSESGSYAVNTEIAVVTWYDRTDDPGNYEYKVKKAVTTDRVTTFLPPKTLYNGASSDPAHLPRHCKKPNERFIGDYSMARGNLLHALQPMVVVPYPGTTGTRTHTNFNALGHWEK